MKNFFRSALVSTAAALLLSTGIAYAKTDLLVYTAIEADELPMFKKAFESKHSDIRIKWVRDSTGIITSKLLAEKQNPQADIVWGLAATSLMVLDNEGYFEAYAPKGSESLDKRFIDDAAPPRWVGQRAWLAAICVNEKEIAKKGVPAPTGWKDLTKPEYKGMVVMPNPNSSGTGFLDVSAWLQMWGEDEGWKYMDALHQNIAWYTHSGSKPCKQAAAGEIPIGVSFAYRGAKSKKRGAPLIIVAPEEGVGWDIEAMGIVKGAKNAEAAKAFADWSVSREANELYNKAMAVVAMPGVAKPVAFFPEGIEEKMIENDFKWAARERVRILDEWRRRYDAKSLPKK